LRKGNILKSVIIILCVFFYGTSLNAQFTKLWTQQYGSIQEDSGKGVITDDSGNIYITGYTKGDLDGVNAGNSDIFLVKYSSSGSNIWTKQFGTVNNEEANGISMDLSGNIYIAGYSAGGLDGQTNSGGWDVCLTQYDSIGTKNWTKLLGTADNEIGKGIAVDSSSNVYVTGYTDGDLDGVNAGNSDIFLVKYSSSGNNLWIKQLGTTNFDDGHGVAADIFGYIYITGYTKGDLDGNSNAGEQDIFLVK
jgi:hypothetical protein